MYISSSTDRYVYMFVIYNVHCLCLAAWLHSFDQKEVASYQVIAANIKYTHLKA